MKSFYLEGIGLAANGLANWSEGSKILRGEAEYQPEPMRSYSPQLLPQNERRRVTAAVRLAFQAAEDAVGSNIADAEKLPTVFATSDADTDVLRRMCTALATPQRIISPTDFHNSVHNAASGYWGIGVSSHESSITLSAGDASFGAGLIESACLLHAEDRNVLFVAYDMLAAMPLNVAGAATSSFGVGLILAPHPGPRTIACLKMVIGASEETIMKTSSLEALRISNPAARALPLLALLSSRRDEHVVLASSGCSTIGLSVSFT